MCDILTVSTIMDTDLVQASEDSSYLLSLCERGGSGDGAEEVVGVCFVDTATGRFHLGQFSDDRQRTRLRTLLELVQPKEVVLPVHDLSGTTKALLKKELHRDCQVTKLQDGSEFWDADTALSKLRAGGYFGEADDADESKADWPHAIPTSADADNKTKLMALGGILFYLKRLIIDAELLGQGNFSVYDPAGATGLDKCLVLDGQTLQNLDILQVGGSDKPHEGSLFGHLNHCASAFGKRMLKEWVARPLGDPADINARLDAVEELMRSRDATTPFQQHLKQLSDLERYISRVHAFSVLKNQRAVMYSNVTKKKIVTFVKTLDAFAKVSV
jgi:DNA mismatch repair protein MSH6